MAHSVLGWPWLWLPVSLVLTFLLTWILRIYALKRSLVDVPNSRSSHTAPTPRGGGFSVVITFLAALFYFCWYDVIPVRDAFALAGAGGIVASLGFIDDHGHVPAGWRLLGHFVAAGWGVYWLGGIPPISLMGHELTLGLVGGGLACVYVVWLLNLYNFMDGINGIAGIEAVTVCFGGAVLMLVSGNGMKLVLPILVLGASSLGFLLWNFPKAKIFMGDACSGFLGLMFGLITVLFLQEDINLAWGWVVLLAVFLTDSTVTLVRRVLRGEKVYQAHRSHAYQHLAKRFGSHAPVSLGVGCVNLCWLLPLAAAVADDKLSPSIALFCAYIPMIILVLIFNAGVGEQEPI